MTVKLETIDLDQTIQCRAAINQDTVDEYKREMLDGQKFPPVILYGTKECSWIGDGWHRVLAALDSGAKTIPAELRPGGRTDALDYALGANASHGLRRTNKDKRWAVEIALREFADLSSRQIAEKCGVGHHMVEDARKALGESPNAPRVTSDGRLYPAKRETQFPRDEQEPGGETGTEETETKETATPKKPTRSKSEPTVTCRGVMMAKLAIARLEEIPRDDSERSEALALVRNWIEQNET